MKRSNSGFSIVELVIILATVGVIGAIGYQVYHDHQTKTAAVAIPSKIQTKSDLKQAASSLDSQNIDKSLDPTQLDSDVKSLL